MTLKVFSIYDSKIHAYAHPFQMRTTGEAVRAFIDMALDSKTTIAKHPEDYTLFELATYDDNSGKFENLHVPISLGDGVNLSQAFVEENPFKHVEPNCKSM